MKRFFLKLLMLSITLAPVAAQGTVSSSVPKALKGATSVSTTDVAITGAMGTDFTISTGGTARKITPQDTVDAIYLNANDVLQTGPGTYADITLGDGTTIRIAEKTSLMIKTVDSRQGKWTFNIVYGRILVRSGVNSSLVSVLSGGSATEVQAGAIVSIDYTVVPKTGTSEKPALTVSVIAGNAAVLPRYADPAYGRILIHPDETLLVDALMNNVERSKMNQAIIEYWDRHKIVLPNGLRRPEDPPPLTDRMVIDVKNAGVFTGVTLMLIGAVLQGVMHTLESTYIPKESADIAFAAGYAPIAIGAFVLIGTYMYRR